MQHQGATAKTAAKKSQLQPAEDAVQKMEQSVSEIKQMEEKLRRRQQKMRKVTEDSASSMLWFSAISVVIVLGASIFQVVYLQGYLKSKSFID
jgi:Na+/glutamate symporter